ncbi:MAG: hypothetical protein H9W81_01080 [Enterococcus sp.]|nr:hypothetical protein [Enterococcus sp.]
MENYLKFPLPDFFDVRMSIVWLCVSAVILTGIFYALWKQKPHNVYPRLALTIGILGIIGLPGVMLVGNYINETKLIESMETNYDVEVVSHQESKFLVSTQGEINSCSVYKWQDESYYVLCDVPAGRLLLNELVSDTK